MASKAELVLKNVELIEKAFKHHGLWGMPSIPPPQIAIREDWPEDVIIAAKALNKIFYIRSIQACARMFGQVQESRVQAFFEDYGTPAERVDYARSQANLLLSDIKLLRGLDLSSISHLEE
jgi:hypothetical protein